MLDATIMDYKEYKLAAILSVDLPESPFVGEGEEEAAVQEAQRRLIQESAASHGGTLVKAIGDSYILSFANSSDAVICALELQKSLGAGTEASKGAESPARARMGIHLGDVYFFENDVFGDVVNAASALQAASRPGAVSVSAEVLSLVQKKMLLKATPLQERRSRALPAGISGFEIETSTSPESPGGASREAGGAEAREMSRNPSLVDIRKAVLEEIRLQGRRLTVDEALRKFGWYGVEATEVIASLADAGILIGKAGSPPPPRGETGRREVQSPAGDIGKSIESAIHAIVSEIERAVEEGSRRSRTEGGAGHPVSGFNLKFDKEAFKESAEGFKDVGREIRRQVRQSRHAERRGHSREGSLAPSSSLQKYRDELAGKAGKLRKGLIGNIISFLVINAGLNYINVAFPQSRGFPWAPIVSVFWGFGVVDSIFSAIRASRHLREVEALPSDLDEERTKEIKAIHKERNSIGKHFISTLSIPSFLYLINSTVDPGNPWFIIPSAILAVAFVVHFITYAATIPSRTRRFFEKIGIKNSRKGLDESRRKQATVTKDLGAYTEIYRQAEDSAMDIEQSLSRTDPAAAAEMKPQLENYLNQVLLLSKTANELDAIIGEIPMEALQKDKAALKGKLGEAQQTMRSEYEGSIKEIEKQEESFKALAEQREVIELRLRSSVNQLHQLKMDLARAKAADTESDAAGAESALTAIRARTRELSTYIDDLRQGRLEAIADPFLELEKKYGEASSDTPEGSSPGSSNTGS